MAAARKKKPETAVKPPPGRALRYGDLTPEGQGLLDKRMEKLGNARSGQAGIMRGLRASAADPEKSEKTRDAAARRLVTHQAMKKAGAFENRPVTMENAVESQVGYIERGMARGRADAPMSSAVGEPIRTTVTSKATGEKRDMEIGSGSNVTGLGELGADWYFRHHAKLAAVAAETNIPKQQVITGSAVMSPQNNPVQELAAVGGLARAHADPKARVKISPEAVAKSEDPSLGDWVGRSPHPSAMGSSQFAALKDPKVRSHVKTKGDVDLAAMAKGGTTENVTKAVDVLRGNTPTETAIDPHSSPKVWSYNESTTSSEAGAGASPESMHVHEEFLGRMDNALRQIPGQQRMDTFGLKNSTEGILSPTHPIANDTWMQAAQAGQRPEVVDTGRSGKARFQSPAKFGVGEAGSASEKRLTAGGIVKGGSAPMLRHAWGQESVERVAQEMSERSGEIIPSVGAQGVVWTEIRRQSGGGKDAEYEAAVAAHHKANPAMSTTSIRERRLNEATGKSEPTGGMREMSWETHAAPGKGQGTMLTSGEGGSESLNPRAVLSQARQKGLVKQAAKKAAVEAAGEQGALF